MLGFSEAKGFSNGWRPSRARAPIRVGCVVWTLGAAGCAGGDGGAPEVNLGLPRGKALSELTDEEARLACEAERQNLSAVLDWIAPGTCTYSAVYAAQTPSECERRRDACLERHREGEGELLGPSCGEASAAGLNGCDGTVADYEACLNDSTQALDATLSAWSCSDAAEYSAQGQILGVGVEIPASCIALGCQRSSFFE